MGQGQGSNLGAFPISYVANLFHFVSPLKASYRHKIPDLSRSLPSFFLTLSQVSALDGAVGRSAGETAFTLQLTDCVAPTADEHFTTLFQATNPSAAGNLVNTAASGATGVALQLLDSVGGNPVDLAGGAAVPAGDIVLANGATSTSYDYAVQYVSEAATVTPGPVLGAVTYTLRYE